MCGGCGDNRFQFSVFSEEIWWLSIRSREVWKLSCDAVVLAVGHQQFVAMGAEGIRAFGKPESVLFDVKCVLPQDSVDGRL